MTSRQKVQTFVAAILECNGEPSPRPGLAREEIIAPFSGLGRSRRPALIDLSAWCDGIHHLDAFLFDRDLDAILCIFESGDYPFDRNAGGVHVPVDIWNNILDQYQIKFAWQ